MRSYMTIWVLLVVVFFGGVVGTSDARQGHTKVKMETLLGTSSSWDGRRYPDWPAGKPQVSVLRIEIPPATALPWHSHPIINVAYVEKGALTVENRLTGEKKHVSSGEVLPELVNTPHRGFAGAEGATLIVFYAGNHGTQLSEPAPPED